MAAKHTHPQLLRWVLNWMWPPFWGTGIFIEEIKNDYSYVRVRLKYRWYNLNYVRVHFGGSLYAMTDPFFMLLTLHQMGSDYRVWDIKGEVEYLIPGRNDVLAEFFIPPERIDEIKQQAANGDKVLPNFEVELKDAKTGEVVARVVKTLYVRRKKQV